MRLSEYETSVAAYFKEQGYKVAASQQGGMLPDEQHGRIVSKNRKWVSNLWGPPHEGINE